MEISKKEKILNIIFTSLVLVIACLGIVALFGDTYVRTTVTPFNTDIESHSILGSNGFIKEVQNYIEQITSGSVSGDAVIDLIQSMIGTLVVLISFVVVSIIMTVFFIIIIVRSVQVYCGKRDSKTLFASFLKFIMAFFNFVMIVLLVNWTKEGSTHVLFGGVAFTETTTIGLGWGTMLGLVASFVGIGMLIVGQFLYPNERPLITKFFSAIMVAMLSFVIVFVFIDSVKSVSGTGHYHTTMFEVFRQLFSFKNFSGDNPIISMQKAIIYLSIGYFGFVLTIIGVNSFARSVIYNELGVNDRRLAKYGASGTGVTSTMVKAILAFAFTSIGLILSTWMYCKLYAGPFGVGYQISTIPILVIIFLGVVLGFAITNKCLAGASKKEEPTQAEEAK